MQLSEKDAQRRLLKSIGHLVESPEIYDTFIKSWQALIDDGQLRSATKFAIEKKAETVMSALSDGDCGAENGPVALEKIKDPAFLVDEAGIIKDLNDTAWARYGLDIGGAARDLPLTFHQKDALGSTVTALVNTNSIRDVPTIQSCVDVAAQTNYTVLFMRMPGSPHRIERLVLMVVNTGQGVEHGAQLIAQGYALTQNEQAVLLSFLSGRGLSDIADSRSRSIQTIRNQMQSIFEKTGCNGQADLMRLVFSLSNLVAEVPPLLAKANSSNRQSVTFLRPDGRVVGVTVAGARRGRPVVSLPSIFGHPITPAVEESLTLANIKMLCIARPGMGETDPPATDMSEVDCLRDDILAVLEQIKETNIVLIGRASAAPTVFELCAALPDIVTKAVIVNAVLPSSFVTRDKVASSWTQSLMAAAISSPTMARLILRSGWRLMRVIGPGRFLSRMYGNSASDVDVLADPDVVGCIEEGVQMVTAQGFEAGSRDMIKALGDWADCVRRCPVTVRLVQGDQDPNVPIEASRAFAAAFPAHCSLREIHGGGLLNFSHADEIIHELTG